MTKLRVSLDCYLAFAQVAETGSFSTAARELGVSKATISKQIAALEAALGVSLLARTTRRLGLTEAGEHVQEQARMMLVAAEAAQELAANSREQPRGRLRISAPVSWSIRYLKPVLPQFLHQFPDIRLDLSLEDRAVDLIGEGFDLAIRIRHLQDSAYLARQLAPVRHHIVAAPAYLKEHGTPTHPSRLSDHACLQYANLATGQTWRFIRTTGESADVRIEGRAISNNFDVFEDLLLTGAGIALAPDFLCWQGLKTGGLVPVLCDWTVPDLTLHVLTPPGRTLSRKVRVMSDFLHSHFGGGRAPWLADEEAARA